MKLFYTYNIGGGNYMDLKRVSLELLFHDVPISQVIDHLRDKDIPILTFEDFYHISLDRFASYSKDEVEDIYQQCCESIDMYDCRTFFYELGKYNSNFLSYNKYEPLVDYRFLMRWTSMYHLLGQDLLVCAFLAYYDYIYDGNSEFFAYRSVIKTNNQRLHNILDQGMAENHFHLKGSTKIFEINWISLMNHPFNREKDFATLKYKMIREKMYKQGKNYTLQGLCNVAAVVRMYLFLRINHNTFEDIHVKYKGKLWDFINIESFDQSYRYMDIINVGKNLVHFNPDLNLDYANMQGVSAQNLFENAILVGERKLLYECFKKIISGDFSYHESVITYLYVLIKSKFRNEIIQINNRKGFENFSIIERRKELFVEDFPKYQDELIRLAVINTCLKNNVTSLEARIVPKTTCKKIISTVKRLDNLVNVKDGKLNIGENNTDYFYVWHFVKHRDNEKDKDYLPRNASLRNTVEIQARALAEALSISPYVRARTRGIDACNNENFARPEAFAQAFRFLNNFSASNILGRNLSQIPYVINMTYHVGEDFPDILDGLRAIDEAILFCNLNNRSRIGHGVALGLDADWYYAKKTRLIFTSQSFLDNISWLYAKCIEYDIVIETSYFSKINAEFQNVFRNVYVKNRMVDINEYHEAWKLRGDNPYLYKDGVYKKQPQISRYDYFKENRRIPQEVRTDDKVAELYYAYHFDEQVRKRGKQKYIYTIDCKYIHLVKEVQKKMQFDLARKGIMIECNPTSNYMISQLSKYEDHPIIKFYNYELSKVEDINCAQLCVSINTDDQGVFDTSLENEYALMAYALEYAKDSDGNYLYTASEVYKWIDSIRKMGLQQVFK